MMVDMTNYIDITIKNTFFFFSSRRRHTRFDCDWSSDVCSSDLGPLSTQAKTANVVMVSGTSGVINPNNPYMVRTSFTLGQQSGIIAEWAAKNGNKKVAIIQSDWAPGAEAAAVFTDAFTKAGGQLAETVNVPLNKTHFAPLLQRARGLPPDTTSKFVPARQAGDFP